MPDSSTGGGIGLSELKASEEAPALLAGDDDLEAQSGGKLLALDQSHSPHDGPSSSAQQTSSAPTSTRSTSGTILYLDGLRGFAALMVYVSHHMSWVYGADAPLQHGWGWHGEYYFANAPFIRPFFAGGSAAVAIFFVLSGYVLSRSPLRLLLEGPNSTAKLADGLLSAFIRRPFRLFIPPAGVALVTAFCLHLPFGLAPNFTWPKAEANIFLELWRLGYELICIFNPFIIRTIATRWFPYNPPAWTMSVEWQGSMIVFFFLWLASRIPPLQQLGQNQSRNLVYFFAVSSAVALVVGYWFAGCFLAGVTLALNDLQELDERRLLYRLSAKQRSYLFHGMLVVAWYLFGQVAGMDNKADKSYDSPGWYYLTMLTPAFYFNFEYWRWWNSIGGVLCVYSVTKLGWVQRFLTTPAMRYIGRVSFSLYLVHIPFLWVMGDIIYRLFGKVQPSRTTWADNILRIPDIGPQGLSTHFIVPQLVMFPLTLIFSELSTRAFDQPSITIGKRVVSYIRGSKS